MEVHMDSPNKLREKIESGGGQKMAAIGRQLLVQKQKMLNKSKKCTYTPAFSSL